MLNIALDALEALYKEHIDSKSIIYIDSHKSYIQFAKGLELDHKRIMITKNMLTHSIVLLYILELLVIIAERIFSPDIKNNAAY